MKVLLSILTGLSLLISMTQLARAETLKETVERGEKHSEYLRTFNKNQDADIARRAEQDRQKNKVRSEKMHANIDASKNRDRERREKYSHKDASEAPSKVDSNAVTYDAASMEADRAKKEAKRKEAHAKSSARDGECVIKPVMTSAESAKCGIGR